VLSIFLEGATTTKALSFHAAVEKNNEKERPFSHLLKLKISLCNSNSLSLSLSLSSQ